MNNLYQIDWIIWICMFIMENNGSIMLWLIKKNLVLTVQINT